MFSINFLANNAKHYEWHMNDAKHYECIWVSLLCECILYVCIRMKFISFIRKINISNKCDTWDFHFHGFYVDSIMGIREKSASREMRSLGCYKICLGWELPYSFLGNWQIVMSEFFSVWFFWLWFFWLDRISEMVFCMCHNWVISYGIWDYPDECWYMGILEVNSYENVISTSICIFQVVEICLIEVEW